MEYRSTIIKLFEKIFIETGDARSRIQNCESKITHAYIDSSLTGVPIEVQDRWEQIWSELNKEEGFTNNGIVIQSSLRATTKKMRNKSMEKYLLFFLEEFLRVTDK